MTDQLFQFSLNDVIGEFEEFQSIDHRRVLVEGTLEDGRDFQVHLIITTDEGEFILSTSNP